MNPEDQPSPTVPDSTPAAAGEVAAREGALALMRELENRPFHVLHVARLALQLFDQLVELHGFGPRERLLLEAAAYLHDVGHQFEFGGEGHHKESARIIRERPWAQFTPREVEVIAQVARYHRKAMPEKSHDEFRALDDWSRLAVRRLAALLRLADSLDRAHQQIVRQISAEVRPGQLVLHLDASAPVVREVKAAQTKGDLAVAVFQRELLFMVGGEVVKLPPA
jgi:exopolyphosphatase/guanosine-5'-triphosphate,3'-diphosphate pyrophosphatase